MILKKGIKLLRDMYYYCGYLYIGLKYLTVGVIMQIDMKALLKLFAKKRNLRARKGVFSGESSLQLAKMAKLGQQLVVMSR